MLALLVAGVAACVAAGCGGAASDRPPASALGDDTITVGSFDFAESRLLAEIYSQALEGGRYPRAPGAVASARASSSVPRCRAA